MINWTDLFNMQRKFNGRILREKGLEGTDIIPWMTVSFLVELSEFANEARWFKMWSNYREPIRSSLEWDGHENAITRDPLLEEFVDALHFAIGIGLELGFGTYHEPRFDPVGLVRENQLTEQYLRISKLAAMLNDGPVGKLPGVLWAGIMQRLLFMGELLGITDGEIVTAFKTKDIENHARQDRGY